MKYNHILVTGGAGFVGSNICLHIKQTYKNVRITALDNLVRRGSELNISRLKDQGIVFQHGDVRNKEDLTIIENIDLIIECSAEPSVLAGIHSSPEYVIQTNLVGAINCFELARRKGTDVIFFSTSRVYPIDALNSISLVEQKTRFSLMKKQKHIGVTKQGISELFSLDGTRSFYGTTKLSAEFILQEYNQTYGVRSIINRCGVITGPWQMGKVDQGVIVLWLARHMFQKKLSYFGFNGKQVRDIVHIADICDLIELQLENFSAFTGNTFNVGGGLENSVSLVELTALCQAITGQKMHIPLIPAPRVADIKYYVSDYGKIKHVSKWKPKRTVEKTLADIYSWINENKQSLQDILS